MDTYHIINLHDRPDLRQRAAEWFHRQWGIPAEDYLASMDWTQAGTAVPQWYVAVAGAAIIGGVGVIDNDFHRRKDLTPNVCALYVEAAWRGRGIAGQLLERVCRDMKRRGCGALYAACIRRSEVIAYPDLGPEALLRLEVEDFPAICVIDAKGCVYH